MLGGQGVAQSAYADLLTRVHQLGRGVVADNAADVDQQARFPKEALAAFREERLLSAYIPVDLGGMGLSMTQVAGICEALGQYCASTAMVYAMHQIQVACMVHHGQSSDFFRGYLQQLSAKQWLLASATTEIGAGGDLASSRCAVEIEGEHMRLEKQAPVISYALDADAILVTCRRAPDAAPHDQSLVLVTREQVELSQTSGWDTLGFRGTCSLGFVLKASGPSEQIMSLPFADILSQSMHPFSHMVWGSLWLGLADAAVQRARKSVRARARKNPDAPQVSRLRLAELGERLFAMRAGLYRTMERYQQLLNASDAAGFNDYGFVIDVNNTKINCSEQVVDIVGRALLIVGISGYKNDAKLSLTRHLRDAYGAALMVNNDRIRGHNATMQIIAR